MRCSSRLPALFLGLLVLTPPIVARSAGINFEELVASNDPAVVLSDEYAHLGVQFVGLDGSIWHGTSDGDPGGFGLEGTNGASFLGFDGGTFSTDLHFDPPVHDLTLDLARGEGGNFHFTFLLQGFREGNLVDQVATNFGAVGEWNELALSGEIDHVMLWSIGDVRYGVDDVRWEGPEPSALAVEIDIMPGSEHNSVRLGRPGVLPVVLFGADDFDVMEVDLASLELGPDGAPVAHRNGPHFVDIDGDGLLDLLAHFRVQASGIAYGEDQACLSGERVDGAFFEGCDSVRPVSSKHRRKSGRRGNRRVSR